LGVLPSPPPLSPALLEASNDAAFVIVFFMALSSRILDTLILDWLVARLDLLSLRRSIDGEEGLSIDDEVEAAIDADPLRLRNTLGAGSAPGARFGDGNGSFANAPTSGVGFWGGGIALVSDSLRDIECLRVGNVHIGPELPKLSGLSVLLGDVLDETPMLSMPAAKPSSDWRSNELRERDNVENALFLRPGNLTPELALVAPTSLMRF
jgi:hypothetical protein